MGFRVKSEPAGFLLQCALLYTLLFSLQYCVAETRICLNMIAKDEADEILKTLEPLVAELSGWNLCDTGSSDNTIQIVEEFFDKHSVPGSVSHHEWKDFGHNRNLCIEEGMRWSREEANRQGMEPDSHYCDYLLFLDADQILHLPPGRKPGELKAMDLKEDNYFMQEKGVGVTYWNQRLASTRVEWQWVGEVHEYVERKDGLARGHSRIPDYWLFHDASGGKGGNRFVRDEAILARVVRERPADPRSRFYYANTLRALNRKEEAITHYIQRIRIGGWDEEMFMSALNIADIAKDAWDKGQLISPQVKAAVGNWGSHFIKLNNATEELEQQQLTEAEARLAKALNETQNGKKGEDEQEHISVTKARTAVDLIKVSRRHREFNWVVAAYQAALAILPYRPEPWTHLAKLYRLERNDNEKCYIYASAALGQVIRPDGLFVNTNMMAYETLDEMCACAYWVDRAVQQGVVACHKLEQKLVADLVEEPENPYRTKMLERVRANLKWYAKKLPQTVLASGADACTDESSCGALSMA